MVNILTVDHGQSDMSLTCRDEVSASLEGNRSVFDASSDVEPVPSDVIYMTGLRLGKILFAN